MGRTHRVFAALDQWQADHQGMVVETTSTIRGIPISILYDSSATNSFISPFLVECCGLVAAKQDSSWQVELASGARVVTGSLVPRCELNLGKFTTSIDLRVISLGSYGVVLGMDWLEAHGASIDYRKKTIICKDDEGIECQIVGIPRPISLRMILAMQLKCCI